MTFTKLFGSITESTIWAEPDHTRLVWITMLAMADHAGRVWGSIPGLANRARVPLEKCEEALQALQSPDKYSRTKAHEGRRIEDIDGGWRLLNHAKYRDIRDEESRKESKRRYINGRRAAERMVTESGTESTTMSTCRQSVSTVDQCRPNAEADTEAYTEAEADLREESLKNPSSAAPAVQASRNPPKLRKPKVASSPETWNAYSEAYLERYGVLPVRNAKVNSQLAGVVGRLGLEEAPGVARFYLLNRNSLYVNAKHCTDLLLRDCEKLRTEWVTGQTTYQRDAREEDRLASTGEMWDRVGQKLAEKGIT